MFLNIHSQNCAPYNMASAHGWLAGDWPSTRGEAFSTLLRRPGLRTSTGGVLVV